MKIIRFLLKLFSFIFLFFLLLFFLLFFLFFFLLLIFFLPPPLPRCSPFLLPLPLFPHLLLPSQFLAKLFANFGEQCIPLDFILEFSQLNTYHWTSTWDLANSIHTTGSQSGTCPGYCIPLDLNLGIPSSVRIVGPQKPNKMPEDMPNKI